MSGVFEPSECNPCEDLTLVEEMPGSIPASSEWSLVRNCLEGGDAIC